MHSKYHAAALAIGLAVAAGLAGCKPEAPTAGAAGGQPPPPNVVVVPAEARDVPVYIDAIGKATAVESVVVRPRVNGQIIERDFVDGADITKGQVLFKIDPEPAKAALASAQAQLAQSEAAGALAQIELDRYTQVAGTNAISKADLDIKKNAVDVANAQVAAARAAVRQAEINLEFCTIVAPIGGRAGARMIDVGNVVKENETPLLSIQGVDKIYADFTVNEQDLTRVRANMAEGTLKTYVRLPSDDEKQNVPGELTFLDNAVQDGTGTVRLRATLDNETRTFWPGQFVQVRLVLRTMKDAVLVPAKSTQIGQGGPFVLVVKQDMTAEQRDVVIGQQQGDLVVIEAGVRPGERIVTEGQLMVRPGGPVQIAQPHGAPPAEAAKVAAASSQPSAKPIPGGDVASAKSER
jgi:multidrug efflux system membrane fusion protein